MSAAIPRKSVPSPAEAIGSLEALPPGLRRAFTPLGDFAPLPEPGPGDWLAHHPEPGQTFDAFLRSARHRPDARRQRLYLLPLGDFVPGHSPALARLREFTAAFFGLEAEVLPALDPAASALPGRRNPYDGHAQLDAHAILGLLERRLPADGFALLGLTMVDLYPDPAWNFVFGLASPAERVGVFSFARYDPAFYGEARSQDTGKLLLQRSCKVLAHETGHLFGLEHCVFYRCLMNGSNHLAESDARPLHLCPVCLRKLQESVGFDPTARERHLLGFARRVGVDDEARWLERRLEHLGSAPD